MFFIAIQKIDQQVIKITIEETITTSFVNVEIFYLDSLTELCADKTKTCDLIIVDEISFTLFRKEYK